MTIWDLRQMIESSIPVWIIGVLFIIFIMIGTVGIIVDRHKK